MSLARPAEMSPFLTASLASGRILSTPAVQVVWLHLHLPGAESMMSSFITLTDGSITVIDASKGLDISNAVLVEQYDEIDVDIWVQSLTGSPKLDLYTSVQNQFDDIGASNASWVTVMTQLAPVNAGHNIIHLPTTGKYLLRYLRWYVTASAGQVLTFTISGIARRKSF